MHSRVGVCEHGVRYFEGGNARKTQLGREEENTWAKEALRRRKKSCMPCKYLWGVGWARVRSAFGDG